MNKKPSELPSMFSVGAANNIMSLIIDGILRNDKNAWLVPSSANIMKYDDGKPYLVVRYGWVRE